jgi:molybdenum cofactor guanylyltransferase
LSNDHPHLDPRITGLILAGGLGRRIGERDKGLVEFRGKAMIAHILERFAPQVDELLINANRNIESYAQFGQRVVGDTIEGHAGPLAGLEAGLTYARHDLLASVPCDAPRLATDLVVRLYQALQAEQADVAVAKTGTQVHAVFCLVRRSAHQHLRNFLAAGGRKVDAWYASLRFAEVGFDDEADAFANINTLDELQHWETTDE